MNNNDQRLMVLSQQQQQQQQRRFPTHLAPKMAFHHGELTLDFMQGLILAPWEGGQHAVATQRPENWRICLGETWLMMAYIIINHHHILIITWLFNHILMVINGDYIILYMIQHQ